MSRMLVTTRAAIRARETQNNRNYNNAKQESNSWNYGPSNQVLRLSIYALVYAFYNDDGVLTLFEKSKLMRIVKKEPYSFNKRDKNELKKYIENNPTKNAIVNFMKQNELSLSSLTLAYKLLGVDIVKNTKYKTLFDSLINHVEGLEK